MSRHISIHLDFSAVVYTNGAEEQVYQQHHCEGQGRQKHQAGLQKLVKWEVEDIKPDIHSKDWVGNAKGRSVTEAYEVIPLGVIADAEQKSDGGARQCNIHHQELRREFDSGSCDYIQFRPEARRSRLPPGAVIGAVYSRLAQIDP